MYTARKWNYLKVQMDFVFRSSLGRRFVTSQETQTMATQSPICHLPFAFMVVLFCTAIWAGGKLVLLNFFIDVFPDYISLVGIMYCHGL